MQLNLTKLASALVLSSSLAGCAAMVRTPYEQPAVNMPSSFQNSKAANQKIHADAKGMIKYYKLRGDYLHRIHEIKKGDLVKHKIFGIGRITEVSKVGREFKLQINFSGTKRDILASFVEKI